MYMNIGDPETREGIGSHGAGVTSVCELLDMSAGN